MASVVFYFQVHQPFRIKDYSFFKIGVDHQYFAIQQNTEILHRIADRCYLPTNGLIRQAIQRTKGKFKATFSFSGTVLEQFELHRPEVIESFRDLLKTGCVEFLGETFYHSLAGVFSETEFERQVLLHKQKLKDLFDYEPATFRNTELIFNDRIAAIVKDLGFTGIVTEGTDRLLGLQSPNHVYELESLPGFPILLRNFTLSDDISFRFSDPSWPAYPLTPAKYAEWLKHLEPESDTIGLFMDYETFGEHRQVETGIFSFLAGLPEQVLKNENLEFATVSEALCTNKPFGQVSCEDSLSWADESRDLSAWLADNMQKDAVEKVYSLKEKVLAAGNEELLKTWGRLQTSDHFYYMSAKYWFDPTHQSFNPYRSPYDAYINYMNVLSDFERLLG